MSPLDCAVSIASLVGIVSLLALAVWWSSTNRRRWPDR